MKDLAPHSLTEKFPPLRDSEYLALKASILSVGLVVPIVLRDGFILDGRARYRACRELGIDLRDCHFIEYPGGHPYEVLIALNGVRRHLTKGQRACCAAEYADYLDEKSKE
jgi:ParB-like chromosome segregation protein Spo0J